MYDLPVHTAEFTEQDRAAPNSLRWLEEAGYKLHTNGAVSHQGFCFVALLAKVESHLFFSQIVSQLFNHYRSNNPSVQHQFETTLLS